MKKKCYDGYFTVEAAYIVPMVFILIVLMIQYGFFCYEKSISLQCCYLSVLRATNEWELTGKEIENYAVREVENLLEERALYPAKRETSATITLLGLEVKMEGYMEVLFFGIGEDGDGWELDSKKSAGKTVPSEYIRKYYVVKSLGGENDGNNQ